MQLVKVLIGSGIGGYMLLQVLNNFLNFTKIL